MRNQNLCLTKIKATKENIKENIWLNYVLNKKKKLGLTKKLNLSKNNL